MRGNGYRGWEAHGVGGSFYTHSALGSFSKQKRSPDKEADSEK